MAADPYAVTLWAFLHGKDAQHLEALVRESERIDLAEILTRGWIGGTDAIRPFRNEFHSKLMVPVGPATREELSKNADELWRLHESKKRPVS